MATALAALMSYPSIAFAPHPTPIDELTRLRRALGPDTPRLLMKRDDLLSFAMGGNKVRKIQTVAPEALAAISNPGEDTPGAALQMFISDVFIEKGCAFEAAPESLRVNGVFLSFDSKSAKDIRCKGKPSKLEFGPDGMALADTLYFFSNEPAP